MNNLQEDKLWLECHDEAQDLEAFEPGLAGLASVISVLEQGQPLSEAWVAKAKEHLSQNHAIAELSLRLNCIAGLRFEAREFEKSKVIAEAALTLYLAVFGIENETSQLLANNLKKLKAEMKPKTLPKLHRFSAKPRNI
jgi:hypothetical protein